MLRPVAAVAGARRVAGARQAVTEAVNTPGPRPSRRMGDRLERRGAGRRAERPRRRTDPRARPAGRPPPGRRGHPGRRDGGSDRPARGRAVYRPCPNWPAWPRRDRGPTGTPPAPAPCPDGWPSSAAAGSAWKWPARGRAWVPRSPCWPGRRPAARMEPFAGELVGRALAEAGVDVRIGITVTAVRRPAAPGRSS